MALYTLPNQFNPDFYVPKRWPVGSIEVDWSNPITDNLQVALPQLAKNGVNLATNGQPAGFTAPLVGTADYLQLGGAYGGYDNFDYIPTSLTDFTVMIEYWPDDAITGSNYYYPLGFDNKINIIWDYGPIGSSNTCSVTTAGGQIHASINAVQSEWNQVIATYDGSDIRTYRNGTFQDSTAQTGAVTTPTSCFGAIGGWNGRTRYMYFWDRVLSERERNSIMLNPYQMFKPVVPSVYFSAPPLDLNQRRVSSMHFGRPWEPTAMGPS